MPFATRRYIRRQRKHRPAIKKRIVPRKKRARSVKKKTRKRKKNVLQILTDLYHSKAPKKGVVPYRFKPLKLDRGPRARPRVWQGGRDFGEYPWRWNDPPGQEIYDHLH